MVRGFGLLYAPAELVCVTSLRVFVLHCVWRTMYVLVDLFTFLIIHHWYRYWVSSQVVIVVVVDLVQMFPFP